MPPKRKRTISQSSARSLDSTTVDIDLTSAPRRRTRPSKYYDEEIKAVPVTARLDYRDDHAPTVGANVEIVDQITSGGKQYHIGEFVLVRNPDAPTPNVAHIYGCWKDDKMGEGAYINWCYRPWQTFHDPSRQFYPNEVFRTIHFTNIAGVDILDRCYVLPPKLAEKGKPKEWVDGQEIFVCGSVYSIEERTFEGTKSYVRYWPLSLSVDDRKQALEIVPFKNGVRHLQRVPSQFFADKYIKGVRASIPEDGEANGASNVATITTGHRVRPRNVSISNPAVSEEKDRLADVKLQGLVQGGSSCVENAEAGGEKQMAAPAGRYNTRSAMEAATESQQPARDAVSEVNSANDPGSTSQQQVLQQHSPPSAPPQLAPEIVQYFPKDAEGRILWFSTPPVVITDSHKPRFSAKYLEWFRSR
ncbi:hypothetical protein EV182_002437 [Spiromyces aspiralis]|uniref:Uncharacterized protein n=1 Tax=Spiromyces aspiralis TaxID=68401 RepID=A0ACC1HSN5_9FUNG|nr:hypothetical protein EV182_002437 [Spiromyces aspiralis]